MIEMPKVRLSARIALLELTLPLLRSAGEEEEEEERREGCNRPPLAGQFRGRMKFTTGNTRAREIYVEK